MKATCVDCKKILGRGWYIDYDDLERMKAGEAVEIIEVIWCPECHHMAILWDEELTFYNLDENKEYGKERQ